MYQDLKSQAAFHVGRPEYVRLELRKTLCVQKNVPRVLAYWSQKIPWIDKFFNVLAYRKKKSSLEYCQITNSRAQEVFPTYSSSLMGAASTKLSGSFASLSVVNFQIIFPIHTTYTYIHMWYYISIFCLFHT